MFIILFIISTICILLIYALYTRDYISYNINSYTIKMLKYYNDHEEGFKNIAIIREYLVQRKYLEKTNSIAIIELELDHEHEGYTQFGLFKDIIFIKMRDQNGKLRPIKDLLVIVIHEYAHVLCGENCGHSDEFWDIFNNIIDNTNFDFNNVSSDLM
jgi:hypothetical protein